MTMRRLCSLLVLVAIALVAAASAPAANHTQQGLETPPLWDPDEVMTVVLDGMLGPTVSEFHPTNPLTWGDLANALAAWGHPISTPVDAAKPVTIRELDAQLVAALGLQPAAQAIRVGARNAGLKPIPSLGTESVARFLGLRVNHPAAQDNLEVLPNRPARFLLRSGCRSRRCSRRTSSSSARRGRDPSRRTSAIRASTSATAGSSTPRTTASRWSR